MAEFRLTSTPEVSPTKCFICEEFVGPFVDTYIELPGYGRVYICAPNDQRPGCLGQMATLTGYVDEKIPIRLNELVVELKSEVKELTIENEELRQLDQLITVTRKRTERRLEEPDEEPAFKIDPSTIFNDNPRPKGARAAGKSGA